MLPAAAGASLALGVATRSALLAPLSEELSSPEVVAAPPSLLSLVLAAATGGLLGGLLLSLLARRGAGRALAPLLLPGLAALALLPQATALVPPLAALSRPLVDLLLLGSVGAALWRAAPELGLQWAISARTAGVFALGLYLAVGWHLHKEVGLSGDEPHYLLITQSLLRDGDLEIENNYERGDWEEYYSGKIRPHLAQPGRGGARYSIHGVGLPILLLPGFALFGVFGVILTEALLGGFLVHEVFRAAELLGASRAGALLAACGFGATAPALFLSTSAYPELPAALTAIAVFRRLLSPEPPRGWRAAAYGLVVGALGFLHAKFLVLAAVLVLAMGWTFGAQKWRVAVGFLAGVGALAGFFFLLFGDPNPASAYGRQRLFLSGVPQGLAGLLFDQEAGLLPASPFYFFALTALAGLCAIAPRPGFIAAAVLAAVAIPGAAHPLWSGGSSPPARFLFPALPLLAAAAGAYWTRSRKGISPWASSLLLASLLLGSAMTLGPGQPLYLNQRDGSGRIWEMLGRSWDLTHYLPSIVRGDERTGVMVVVGGVVLLSASVLAWLGRSVRLPPLALVGLAVGTFIDWTSPARAPEGSSARWTAELLRRVADLDRYRFYLVPSGRSIAREALLGRLRLLLESPVVLASDEEETLGRDREQPPFQSASFFIPPGTYRVRGELSPDARLCNGEGCLAPAQANERFDTRVGLRWFHLEAGWAVAPYLEVLAVGAGGFLAERTQEIAPGLRLHSLDDNVFFEPAGFWVRGRSTARFLLETEVGSRLVFSLRNAGESNWVEFESAATRVRFALRPWEQRRLETAVEPGLQSLAIGSSAVFRAPPGPEAVRDRRPLGVFVTAAGL
jgi:hypothetical protein